MPNVGDRIVYALLRNKRQVYLAVNGQPTERAIGGVFALDSSCDRGSSVTWDGNPVFEKEVVERA